MSEFKKNALSVKCGKAEIIALIIYIAGLIFIACFHELWFDEAQAWDIAKTASYHKILFEVPHYEGHPQLWHLLLSVFAKNGAPYKLTMQAVNITISSAAMAVLLFKSPFPKIIRCLLPFTYFFFYQYGVYSRPYCITMLAFFLAASFYKERNEHPWRYILSLTLLCLSTAYGIIIAGMYCIVWCIEIITETAKEKKFGKLFRDKRVYSLCFILIVALMLIVSIIPRDDTYYGGMDKHESLIKDLLNHSNYVLFSMIPYESWSGDTIHSQISGTAINISWMVVIGILAWVLLLSFAKKNKRFLTLFLPLIAVVSFMVFKYFGSHHLGIVAMIILFYFWITLDCEHKIEVPAPITKLAASFSSPVLKKIVTVGIIVVLSMPLYYSAASSFFDVRYPVAYAQYADFIKEHHLENLKLMADWEFIYAEKDDNGEDIQDSMLGELLAKMSIPSNHSKIETHYTYLNGTAAVCQPYFDRNIFMNYNVDDPSETYLHYQYKENVDEVFAKWRAKGLPDVIVGYAPIDEVYDEETLEGVTYLPVHEIKAYSIYKDKLSDQTEYVYMREDLIDDYPELYWIHDPKRNLAEKVNNDD